MANPFDDLIPNNKPNPFDDLIQKSNQDQKSSMFTPRMNTPTSMLAQSGAETMKDPTARFALETELTSLIPFLRASKLIPNASRSGKYVADYAGAIAQNAGIGAGLNKLNNNDANQGAIEGAGSTAVIHPAVSMAMSNNPYLRLGGLAALGSMGAYGAGQMTGYGNKYTDALGGIAGLAAGMRGKNINQIAAKELLGNIDEKSAKNTKKAAERLGLSFVTPAESTGNPIALKVEQNAGTSKNAAQELFEKKSTRQKEVKNSIQNLLDEISPKNAYEEIEKPLYEKAHTDSVPTNKLFPLLQDARLRDSFDAVTTDKDFSKDLKDVEPNSIKYLDYVKKHLDDQIEKAEKKGEKNRVRLIKASKDKLVGIMDESSESYKNARRVSAARQTRQELENSMNESEVSGKSFYDKNLSNDFGFNKLVKKLKNNPEAQQKLKDMRLVFKNIMEPLNARALSSAAESSVQEKPFSKLSWVKELNSRLLGGKYDKALIRLMTRDDWDKEFETLAKMKNPNEKGRKLADLLSRIGTVGASNVIQ